MSRTGVSDDRGPVAAARPAARIAPRASATSALLSFGQERLFVLDRIMDGSPAYNVPRTLRVRQTLDSRLLLRALCEIVRRHEILRTTIRLEDGVPVQRIGPAGSVELAVLDLRESSVDRLAAADELLERVACRPFDLSRDLLLRAALVHIGDDEDLLLLVNHHVASDHASQEILLAELDELYSAFSDGREPVLPELPIQYADFALWQRQQLSGDVLDKHIDFWRHRLEGAPDRLDLPADRPRPAAQSYRGERYEFAVDADRAARIHRLAREQSASAFMVLVAAFKTLLHRYTGADDIVIGAPVSGRLRPEIKPLLGFFSNTIVLRTDLSGDPTFAELVARVRRTTVESLAHQELPFERLVEALNPERAPSHSPIFQVVLGYDVAPHTEPRLGGAPVEMLPTPGWKFSRLDLSLTIRERLDGSLAGAVEYAADLFDRDTVERLVDHFQSLLDAAALDPTRKLSELELLTGAELDQFAEWNDTARNYPRRCLHELFGEQAARRPDAIAVRSGDTAIGFRELDELSGGIANELAARGIGGGSLVGICMERSIDLVASMLAVLRTGAAYVPVDPTYPRERRSLIFADAQVPVVLTHEHLAAEIDLSGSRLLFVDRDRDRIAALDPEPPQVGNDPEQLAYVIYTSGSTGKPKGVEVTHRSVANLIAHMRTAPGICEDDIVANLTTPAFDLSVPDWYLPLTTGATLAIIPAEATVDAVRLGEELTRSGATFVQATPTTWQLLVDSSWPGTPGLKIVAGGEALPRRLAEDLRALGQVWHAYGPTETTVWSSLIALDPGEGSTPIGGPIANTTFHVLDGRRRLVPIGVAGELFLGGDGLARGYHGRTDLTAERFVEETPTVPGSGRLYRTGDLLRWRPDGTLEFLGRIDQQVKLRGFRIELGEVEAVLGEHHDVAAAAALVGEDAAGDRRLVAYVVPADGCSISGDQLREHARQHLPQFMVPSTIVVLDALPVSANGKLDRATLPAPDVTRRVVDREYVAPQKPIEQLLASIWSELLGLEQVGVDDDFFDLGGHSLLALKMTSRLLGEVGVELRLGEVFERPTIRALALAIALALATGTGNDEMMALLSEAESVES